MSSDERDVLVARLNLASGMLHAAAEHSTRISHRGHEHCAIRTDTVNEILRVLGAFKAKDKEDRGEAGGAS